MLNWRQRSFNRVGERIVAVAPRFAKFPVAALNPQFGVLIPGNFSASRNRVALLIAKRLTTVFVGCDVLLTPCGDSSEFFLVRYGGFARAKCIQLTPLECCQSRRGV